MRVAFCIFKYFPFGGVQRDLLKLVTACRDRDHEVCVYTLDWQGEVPGGIDVIVVPVQRSTNHSRYVSFADRVGARLERRPADVVVGMNKMPGLDVYFAADPCFEHRARQERSWLYRLTPRYRVFSRLERAVFGADRDTQILTLSAVQADLYQRYYATPSQRLHPLPPGVERNRIAPDDKPQRREAKRRELGLAAAERLLLFVGSGFVTKGLDRALRAFAALPEDLRGQTTMIVIGQDKPDRFERLARRLGIDDRVSIRPGEDDIPSFLFAADALLLPAYSENTGGVILESLVAGLPVLVTENCGYAHYVAEADAGIVSASPFSQDVFDAQLVEILVSPERDRWAANGMVLADNEEVFAMVPAAVSIIEQVAAR